MKKFIYVFGIVAGLFTLASCEVDDYDEPSETFTGKFVDKATGENVQTEIGDNGIQLYMYETSYKDNPTPWNFSAMQDGTFNNTKVFAGTYTVVPYGPFVPVTEQDAAGNYTRDERLKDFKISGTTTHTFEVEPFLRLSVVGTPTVSDNKITVTVHIERGTTNPNYQQDCTDVALFVQNSSLYVGNGSVNGYRMYDARVSTFLSGDDAKNAVGHDVTLTSGDVTAANGNGQNYYIRVGARIDCATNGVTRFNYTEPMTVYVP